jgi:hypothetical protein
MSIFTPPKVPGLGSILSDFGVAPETAGLSALNLLNTAPPSPRLGSTLADIFSPFPSSFLGSAAGILATPPPGQITNALSGSYEAPKTKRKVYFAFRFQDIMRVNNVRKAWCITHPSSEGMRSFYDRSIWGKCKSREDATLMTLMRGGVEHSSAICVLVGTNTWQSRWVKYEIARSVIDGRGLLAVHINGLPHVDRGTADAGGYNPLHCVGIYHAAGGRYYLYENMVEVNPQTGQLGWVWRRYEDYKDAVPLPRYIPSITEGFVMPLARYTEQYDYAAEYGNRNIGAWIDTAASAVGR